jgi:hypothetical protein
MVMGMVVDVGVVKNHIKPKADSTLYYMRKVDLIEYIRTLEHNYNVAVSFNENQARYIESLGVSEVVRCEKCRYYEKAEYDEGYKMVCRLLKRQTASNGFCYCGERKDND